MTKPTTAGKVTKNMFGAIYLSLLTSIKLAFLRLKTIKD
jgi:hypothetical protein